MRQPKGFIVAMPLLAVLVVVAIVAAGGSYWYAKSRTDKAVNLNTTIEANTNVAVNENANVAVNGNVNATTNANAAANGNTNTSATAGWKTYTNNTNHFTLKYPNNWKYSETNNGNTVQFSPPDAAAYTSIELGPTLWVKLVDAITVEGKRTLTNGAILDDCVQNKKQTMVNGIAVTQQDENCFATHHATYFPLGGKFIQIMWAEIFDKNYSEYPKILSTFTFLDETAFNVTNTTILATARSDDNDASKKYIKKVDVLTGKVQKEVVLNVGKLEVMSSSGGSWGAADSIQFGEDGDSIVFNATEQPGMVKAGYAYSSLYFTTISNLGSQKRILHYDNSGKDTLTYIDQWKYDAKNQRIVFIETSTKLEKSTYTLKTIDTASSEVKTLRNLPDIGLIAAVSDTTVRLLVTKIDYAQSDLITIAIDTGKILDTQIAFIEKKLHQTGTPGYGRGGPPGFDQRALSPNGKMFAVWSDILNVHTFSTDVYSFITGLGSISNVTIIWSPDSSSLLATMKDGGKIYKLGTGIMGTIKAINYPYIWAPGKYIVYAQGPKENWSIYRFDPSNNKTLKLDLEEVHPSQYIGFGWVSR